MSDLGFFVASGSSVQPAVAGWIDGMKWLLRYSSRSRLGLAAGS